MNSVKDLTNSPEVKTNDQTYDNPNSSPEQKQNAAKAIDDAIKDNPTVKKIQANMDRINEEIKKDPDAKSKLEKAAEKGWSGAKFLLLLAGGLLVYEEIKKYQNELKGCWESKSDGSTNSKIKISSLTCDSSCSTAGDTTPSPSTVCDPTNPPPNPPCTCPTPPCTDPASCPCGSTCGTNDSSPCSVWCNNNVRVLKSGNYVYGYQCNNPDLFDTIADIASNVDNAVTSLFGDATSFLKNLLKYGLYIVLGVVAIVLLYLAYKFLIAPLFSHKDNSGNVGSGSSGVNTNVSNSPSVPQGKYYY
jgi:hypothetical protein